ncbi:hypothetical protein COS78_01640 [Candidatus Shapirobacteria bacterium CG06_land_8_20_14_3_00_40_12]|uniref:Uncharacterized protein n=2 Tax=Candidatus Shapironibacteriota TaxID=1752721 RepID=A0A2M7TTB2_9BACT|nr:MAG: hypothetical protein COS78_01640 [Candidatus Shapirobacteria bacterium CG06_land_8_20_14_3_00_40_12]PIZ59333.1 MAG: hypothetical protein COY20_02075 [Candidatus Shapirobacteria bacterium CG_4_10_14_0_2_um_filter_40_12]
MFDVGNVLMMVERVIAILGTTIYLIFAVVIVKQVTTMTHQIKDKFNGILIAFSYLHLLFSLLLALLSWTLL